MTWGSKVAEAQTISPPSTNYIDYIDHEDILRTADLYARNGVFGDRSSLI